MVPTFVAAGGREHAGERGEELVVGGVERQVHLPADGVAFLLHLHVLGAADTACPAARGAHRRPPDQRPLAAAAVRPAARRAVIEERQRCRRRRRCLLERFRERSLPGARSTRVVVVVRRGAAQLVFGGEVVDRHGNGVTRARRRQPELQLHAVTLLAAADVFLAGKAASFRCSLCFLLE